MAPKSGAQPKGDLPLAFPDGFKSTDPRPFETWEAFCEHFEENDAITCVFTDVVGDGFLTDTKVPILIQWKYLSKRARKERDLLEKPIQARIVKLNHKRRVATVSLVAKGPLKGLKSPDRIPHSIREGTVMEGYVARVVEDGYVVVVDEFPCKMNSKDVNWCKIITPDSPPFFGQWVKVFIQRTIFEKNKVYVTLKHLLPNPYPGLADRVAKGRWIDGEVMQVDDLGVFVQIEPGVVGLCRSAHILGLGKDEYPDDHFLVGDRVKTRVHWINEEDQKIGLDLSVLEIVEFKDQVAGLEVGMMVPGEVTEIQRAGVTVRIGKGAMATLFPHEVSWSRLPEDMSREFSFRQKIHCVVSHLDVEQERLEVSLRQMIPDPWKNIEDAHEEGGVEKAMVTLSNRKFVRVQLESGLEVDVFEVAFNKSWRDNRPQVDDVVDVEVVKVDIYRRYIAVRPA